MIKLKYYRNIKSKMHDLILAFRLERLVQQKFNFSSNLH